MVPVPLVSVIVIFLNAAAFLEEAIESVLAQTYQHWEIFLVDDGSTDLSTQIAQGYAGRYPGRIVYLDHPDHVNRGKAASRNLGIRQARGEYIAFLDADDIWLPKKLEQQVGMITSYPEAGMLYGNTLYWHSWTGDTEDFSRDFLPKLGVETNTLIRPPTLLPLYLRGRAAVPCTCSVLVRRRVTEEINGFDETCDGIRDFYEDQAFYAKICLKFPTVVAETCWDKYRQRSRAGSEDLEKIGYKEYVARKSFLHWLSDYLTQGGVEHAEIRLAIRKELWLLNQPAWLRDAKVIRSQLRWIKKWMLRLDEIILPKSVQYRLWLRD
jgi:glycosyltransferase involved in cell wall biosynthesis